MAAASASDRAEIASGKASARDRAEAGYSSRRKAYKRRRIKPKKGQR